MEIIHTSQFEPTQAVFKAYDNGLIDMSYGRSTIGDDENNAETKWTIVQYAILLKKYPKLKFYVLFDFSNIENVESTTDDSMKEYIKMLKNPRTLKVASYGQTRAFGMMVDIIGKLSKTVGKLKVCQTRETAFKWLGIKDPQK